MAQSFNVTQPNDDEAIEQHLRILQGLRERCPLTARGIVRITDCPRCGGNILFGRQVQTGAMRAVCVETPFCFAVIE
jgi:hypothetical protein